LSPQRYTSAESSVKPVADGGFQTNKLWTIGGPT
jgi:hypothetical protein